MKSMNDLLAEGPEALAALSPEELKAALAPYIPLSRQPVLPSEKSSPKQGVNHKLVLSALADNAAAIAALRAARK